MKKYILMTFVVISMSLLNACEKEDDIEYNEEENEVAALTEEEKEDLLVLREEEKLARDVYLYAYDKYELIISKNISISEQSHMDDILEILTAYNIPDPASIEQGVFNNTELQDLYNTLVEKVDISMLDALIVGAIVEDLDIRDIETCKSRTTKEDILEVYEVLECGSRNHLRAYYPELIAEGGTYEAQYLTQEDFDEIVNSDKESCY